MILVRCPQCQTEYELDNSLLPEQGRYLQCSNCHDTWFEKPQAPLVLMSPAQKRNNVVALDLKRRPENNSDSKTTDPLLQRLSEIERLLQSQTTEKQSTPNDGQRPSAERFAAQPISISSPFLDSSDKSGLGRAPEPISSPSANIPPSREEEVATFTQDSIDEQGVVAIVFEEPPQQIYEPPIKTSEKPLVDKKNGGANAHPAPVVHSLDEKHAQNQAPTEEPFFSVLENPSKIDPSAPKPSADFAKAETNTAPNDPTFDNEIDEDIRFESEIEDSGDASFYSDEELNLSRRQRRQLRTKRYREKKSEEEIAAATKKDEEEKRAQLAKEMNAGSRTSNDGEPNLVFANSDVDLGSIEKHENLESTSAGDQETAEAVVFKAVNRLSEQMPNRPPLVEKSNQEIASQDAAVVEFLEKEINENRSHLEVAPSAEPSSSSAEPTDKNIPKALVKSQARGASSTSSSEQGAKAKAIEKAQRKPVEALKSDPKLAAIPKRISDEQKKAKIENQQVTKSTEVAKREQHQATPKVEHVTKKQSGFWTGFFYVACFILVVIALRYLSGPIMQMLPESSPWLGGYNQVYDQSFGQINETIEKF